MNTKQLTTSFVYLLAVIGGLFCIVLLAFFIDNQRFEDRIYRNTFFLDTEVSYMNKQEFLEVISSFQEVIDEKEIVIQSEEEIIVSASDIGIGFNADTLWAEVYQREKREGWFNSFSFWLNTFVKDNRIGAQALASSKLLEEQSLIWKLQLPEQEAFEGDIEITGVSVDIVLPESGKVVDLESLKAGVARALIYEDDGYVVSVPYTEVKPQRDVTKLYAMQEEVQRIISLPLELYAPKYEPYRLTLGIKDLASMVRVSVPKDPDAEILIDIDTEVLIEKLSPLYPREARFVVSEDKLSMELQESRSGFDIDVSKTAENILRVREGIEERKVKLVYTNFIEPNFTTEEAEALNIKHLVSSFTTYHSAGGARVENIHLVADILDGKILKSGEILDMNEFLGERTEERGFKEAGTIIKGRLEESVGGGISQFITTLHNAVYRGGYQVIAHKPHTIYFSRYPLGIEATINWPYVDYIFKNDSDSAIYFKVDYTDTSITVSTYSDNMGRSVIGDHSAGRTNIELIEGDSAARRVASQVSAKYNYLPPLVEYQADPSVPRGEEVLESYGDSRFSVNVVRTVSQNGEMIRQDVWPVHYQQDSTIMRKHPCDFYDEEFDYTRC